MYSTPRQSDLVGQPFRDVVPFRPGTLFIAKPFAPADLAFAVRRALEAPDDAATA